MKPKDGSHTGTSHQCPPLSVPSVRIAHPLAPSVPTAHPLAPSIPTTHPIGAHCSAFHRCALLAPSVHTAQPQTSRAFLHPPSFPPTPPSRACVPKKGFQCTGLRRSQRMFQGCASCCTLAHMFVLSYTIPTCAARACMRVCVCVHVRVRVSAWECCTLAYMLSVSYIMPTCTVAMLAHVVAGFVNFARKQQVQAHLTSLSSAVGSLTDATLPVSGFQTRSWMSGQSKCGCACTGCRACSQPAHMVGMACRRWGRRGHPAQLPLAAGAGPHSVSRTLSVTMHQRGGRRLRAQLLSWRCRSPPSLTCAWTALNMCPLCALLAVQGPSQPDLCLNCAQHVPVMC